jgi:hypothetical protein
MEMHASAWEQFNRHSLVRSELQFGNRKELEVTFPKDYDH